MKTKTIPKRILPFAAVVLSLGLMAGVTWAAVTSPNLDSGEWNSQIEIIDNTPAYDETSVDDIDCGTRRQTHNYYLDSVNTNTRDYWTAIHGFAIVLDVTYGGVTPANPSSNDFLANVDTENLLCSLGNDTAYACGFDKDNDLGQVVASRYDEWNGVTVTYQQLDFLPGNPRGLLWQYSANDPGNLNEVPWLNAKDNIGDDSPVFNEGISFGLEVYDDEYTATTASYTLVEHMYINPGADYGNSNNYYHVYTIDADPDQDGDSGADPDDDYVYWHGINGISRSIFEDCVVTCDDLEIIDPQVLSAEDTNSTVEITVEADDDEGGTWEGEYNFSSDGTCEFKRDYPWLFNWSATLTTQDESVLVRNCTPGDTIFVYEVDYPVACADNLSFADACRVMDRVQPNTVPVPLNNLSAILTIEVDPHSFSNGWAGEYEFAAWDSLGALANGKFNESYYYLDVFDTGTNSYTSESETVYFKADPNADVALITVEETHFPDACYVEVPFEAPYCTDLDVTPATFSATDVANNPYIAFTLDAENQNGDTWSGRYTIASNGTCLFVDNLNDAINQQNGVNPLYNTTATDIYAYNCSTSGEVITILEIDYEVDCHAQIVIEEGLFCQDMQVTPAALTLADLNQVTEITIDTYDQNTDVWPGTYDLWSANGTCEFAETPTGVWATTLTTTQNTAYVQNCDQGETIYIQEQNYPSDCAFEIPVEQENLYCASYTHSPTSVTETDAETYFPITFETFDQNGNIWAGNYEYLGDNTCLFTESEADAIAEINGVNPLSTTANLVYAYGCSPGETISISDTAYPVDCAVQITIGEDAPYCGDGNLDPGEICDDGNNIDGDGCDADCTIPEVPSACYDLFLLPETSDQSEITFTITPDPLDWPGPWTWTTTNPNGLFNAADIAAAANQITTYETVVDYTNGEPNDVITVFEATIYADVCMDTATLTGGAPYCGDGIHDIDGADDIIGTEDDEACDDGNNINGDGCSATCQPEHGADDDDDHGADDDDDNGGGGSHYCYQFRMYDPDDFEPSDEDYYYSRGDTFEFTNLSAGDQIIIDLEALSEMNANWEGVGGGFTYDFNQINTLGNGTFTDEDRFENEYYVVYEVTNTEFEFTIRTDTSNTCEVTFFQDQLLEPDDLLEKAVETYNFGWMNAGSNSISGNGFTGGGNATYAHDFDFGFYEIRYSPALPNAGVTSVQIVDTIATDIDGVIADEDLGTMNVGYIEFYEAQSGDPSQVQEWTDLQDIKVKYVNLDENENEQLVPECNDSIEEEEICDEHGVCPPYLPIDNDITCYEGTIEDANGVTLQNLDDFPVGKGDILVRYLGKVHNGSDFDCSSETLLESSCPVQYMENTATAYTSDGRELEASADITIICPFLLTRNAGDIYIEGELDTYDISCYDNFKDYRSTDALVLKLGDSFVSRLSSYIDEMVVDMTVVWGRKTIEEQTGDQIDAITRYNESIKKWLGAPSDTEITIQSFSDLDIANQYQTNPSQNVYRITDADLVFELNEKVPAGAYTFIVEGHDLYINRNILYDDTNVDFSNLKEIPSIAFIVIGGNVHIDNNVEDIVGVYYIQEDPITGVGGEMTGDWTDPFTSLTIYGSVYGNINTLLGQRTFAGPANYDHGNVVLRYDERIFLNTPPGLEEYVDLSSERTVH